MRRRKRPAIADLFFIAMGQFSAVVAVDRCAPARGGVVVVAECCEFAARVLVESDGAAVSPAGTAVVVLAAPHWAAVVVAAGGGTAVQAVAVYSGEFREWDVSQAVFRAGTFVVG